MKRLLHPTLDISRLEMPRLGLPAFRLRILVRSVFVLLALATVALSVVVLKDEKERAWQAYQHGFVRSQAEVMARLRHPSGQLALLNASHLGQGVTPLAPLLLPYAAIDFDDPQKSQQAVEMAGCSVQYPDGASVCAAIGNNPYAGGFIYLVGSFYAGELTPRERGALVPAEAHRARISLDMRGTTYRWIAPYEAMPPQGSAAVRGRLTGFVDNGTPQLDVRARPVRDFRGWLWQNGSAAICRQSPPPKPPLAPLLVPSLAMLQRQTACAAPTTRSACPSSCSVRRCSAKTSAWCGRRKTWAKCVCGWRCWRRAKTPGRCLTATRPARSWPHR